MYSPHLPGGAGITPMSPSAHQEVDTTRDTLSRVPPQVLGIVIETLTLLPGLLLRCERWKEVCVYACSAAIPPHVLTCLCLHRLCLPTVAAW